MTQREALKRTLLLMRDEVDDSVSDDTLLAALTGTRVALIADHANIGSHAAQSAYVTSAMLMARSGHQVYLICPDVPLVGPQLPVAPGLMIEQLMRTGADLIPGVRFVVGCHAEDIDLAVALGDSPIQVPARRSIRLNAGPWDGQISREEDGARWRASWWPMGGMAAATLAAAEAFKAAIKKLNRGLRNPGRMVSVFADTDELEFALAPPDTPYVNDLGRFDCVSGGAIINAAIYALTRLPGLIGNARVIEPERPDLSNLNRYMLLLRSHLDLDPFKAEDLAAVCAGTGLAITPVVARYEDRQLPSIGSLADCVLVGADDIPTRWLVQRGAPEWLGIGATTHWSAMASFHQAGMGCAQCLHPTDDPNDAPIPTVAFVSFLAGLVTAAYFLRRVGDAQIPATEQQVYVTALKAEHPIRSIVPPRADCPTCAVRDRQFSVA